MKMCPVVHFEMPAKNTKRMSDFYAKAFGWKNQQLGADMSDYVVVNTTEIGEDGRPKTAGAINGGFYPSSKGIPNPHPSVVIAVDDIHKHVKIVEEAGGKMINEPAQIPGIGWYASFIDTEGNACSMLQPNM